MPGMALENTTAFQLSMFKQNWRLAGVVGLILHMLGACTFIIAGFLSYVNAVFPETSIDPTSLLVNRSHQRSYGKFPTNTQNRHYWSRVSPRIKLTSSIAGICQAVELKRKFKYTNFIIWEKGTTLGGTWSADSYVRR